MMAQRALENGKEFIEAVDEGQLPARVKLLTLLEKWSIVQKKA